MRSRRRLTVTLLLVSLLAIAAGRIVAVGGLLPYSQHVDETFFTVSIVKMIRNGDANPHFFRYPSLPLYLSTASILAAAPWVSAEALGDLRAAMGGNAYSPPSLYAAPRTLLALMSVGALGLLAVVAWKLFGAGAALLTPLLLGLSGTYQVSAVQYLNVDIVTVFFVAATSVVVFGRWHDSGYLAKAVWPGLLSGMVVASKYNSGLILVPCSLAIFWAGGDDRFRKFVVLGAVSAATFFACVPYSLLDAGFFIEQILYEIEHYRTGQGFANSEPGVMQLLFYLAALGNDFGWPLMALAAVGIARGLVVDRARTVTLISFPVLMLLHMSTNRLNFLRTILPVYAFCAVLQAAGIVAVTGWIGQGIGALRGGGESKRNLRSLAGATVAVALLVGVAFTATWGRLLDRNMTPDPRNQAVDWLRDQIPRGGRVLVAADLGVWPEDVESLGTEWLAPDLVGVEDVLSQSDEAVRWVVLPRYARLRAYASEAREPARRFVERRARGVAGRLDALEREPGARVVLEVPGRAVEVSPRLGRPALLSPRPAVRILAIRPPAAQSGDAGRGGGPG